MHCPVRHFRRAFWIVCTCVLLLPHAAAADPSLSIDLDGDGQRDQVAVDLLEPSILRIWLSASGTTQLIRSHVPLTQIVVADLDGDHRPELIASDGDSRLHVWKRKRNGFRRAHRRHAASTALARETRGSVDDNESEPARVITGTLFAPFALTLSPSPRAPALETFVPAAVAARAFRSISLDLFAPRPPPAH